MPLLAGIPFSYTECDWWVWCHWSQRERRGEGRKKADSDAAPPTLPWLLMMRELGWKEYRALSVNLCGIGMIIYCLWLLKKWNDGFSQMLIVTPLPRPWFIYICLAIGIAVCLTTLYGHVVANCDSSSSLCIYIVSMCSILLLQAGVIVAILFKIDWAWVSLLPC